MKRIGLLLYVAGALLACGENNEVAPAVGAGGSTANGGAGGTSSSAGGGGGGAGGSATPSWDLANPDAGEWPMFKRDAAHRGAATDMSGAITAQNACVKWSRPVTGVATRAGGGAVIAEIAGRWTVLVAVDGSCDNAGTNCSNEAPGGVVALDGGSGAVLWRTPLPNDSRADPYAPLLADIDADGRRELVVPASFLSDANHVYALTTEDEGQGAGAVQWTFSYQNGASSETAPTAGNFDPSDDALEIIFGNDTFESGERAQFFMLSGTDGTLRSSLERPGREELDADCEIANKLDSASPATMMVAGELRAFGGGWGGSFYALRYSGTDLELAWEHVLPPTTLQPCEIGKVRSSPVVADLDGDGAAEVVFGSMYEEDTDPGPAYVPDVARFSEATLRVLDAETGSQRTHVDNLGDWKSGPSVADLDPQEPGLEIAGGRVGGLYTLTSIATPHWSVDQSGNGVGNRSSPAIADIDGDGDLDVVIAVEAGNDVDGAGLYAYDGKTGAMLWSVSAPPLVPTQWYRGGSSSPALGDIDGDGQLEAVYLSANGTVYAVDSDCTP